MRDGESIEPKWHSLVGEVAKSERSTKSSCIAMSTVLGEYQRNTRCKESRLDYMKAFEMT